MVTRRKVKEIVKKYGVNLVGLVFNIQGTADIELDENIYWKAQARMEKEIRALGNVNDIFYRDIA